ncbi:DUF5819 family protein [Psychromicrobium xiongbiense]|uniref:DUF5819 family protein n=1 Tax=Psychromicrobium xiongbiense TaxID=3051184 RepID=UPI0025569CD3|nr:DUF5819 family protein [Psychromicrobium sp. YIM S02556]
MAEPTSTSTPVKRKPYVRVVMVLAVLLTAWHVAASFLWIAPYSDGARSAFPGGQPTLTAYMIPLFGQSWSVFAPEPINGNFTLKVRSSSTVNGQEQVTDWVDATAVELSMIQHNLFPPRAGIQAAELASEFKGAWDNLTADHKVIVGLNYTNGTDWSARLNDKLLSYGNPDVVNAYLIQETRVDRYATQVAKAIWGDKIERVQFQIYRQNITPFAQRNDPTVKPQPLQLANTGWRGLDAAPGQSSLDFAATFRAHYEKTQR